MRSWCLYVVLLSVIGGLFALQWFISSRPFAEAKIESLNPLQEKQLDEARDRAHVAAYGRDDVTLQRVSHIKEILGHDRLITTCNFNLGVDKRAAKKAHQDFLDYERGEVRLG